MTRNDGDYVHHSRNISSSSHKNIEFGVEGRENNEGCVGDGYV
jgi:hypothetical protein